MKQNINEKHETDADGNPTGGTTTAVGIFIEWQNGPLGRGPEQKPNGAFVEGVIQAAIGRIKFYQTANGGKLASVENATALQHLEHALAWLERRTESRQARGVEGTYTP